jgi:oligosaccharide repeat unit polymerase
MNLAIRPGASSRIQLILLLVPVMAFTLIYTARAVLLFMIIIMIASYIAFRPYNHKLKPKLFNKFNLIAGSTGILILFMVFFITQAARMQVGNFGLHQVEMLAGHLRVWFSGNVSAFSIWFDTNALRSAEVSGSNTLAGLNELLGVSLRKPGIYDETVDVSNRMEFSNIYSLFRFLLDDFGVAGTSCVVFLTGALARKLYLDGIYKTNLVSGAMLSGLFVMILWSFVASAFAYNSVLFAWIGYVIVLKFEHRYAVAK